MPELSRFFGIIIYMNWREHPPMHFHAVYGEHEALITLDGKVSMLAICRAVRYRWCANGWLCTVTNWPKIGRWPWRKSP